MKIFKKSIALIMTFCIIATAFAGCGKNKDDADNCDISCNFVHNFDDIKRGRE